MNTHKLFSKHAQLYAQARPKYPKELYQYLARVAPQTNTAWDCACGNGQAAVDLADFFNQVIATDVSEAQIQSAISHDNVQYLPSLAEETAFADQSFDLICVAQALHWFKFDKFWPEVNRLLKPEGVFAAWGYTWPNVTKEVDPIIKATLLDRIEPYWAAQNRLLWNHYEDIDFPFTSLDAPAFNMEMQWTLEALLGFIRSFSATQRYEQEHGPDFLKSAYNELKALWPEDQPTLAVALDFVFYAGRKSIR